MRKDNTQLRAELNEARGQLISRDNLIKDLQHQLSDPTLRKTNLTELKVEFINSNLNRLSKLLKTYLKSQSSLNNVSMKLSMTNEALNKESMTAKQVFEI